MGFRTQGDVDRLKAAEGKGDSYSWDENQPGLSVRIKGRLKSYVVWYSVAGRRHKVTLGACVGMKLADARAKASRIVGDAKDGKDVLAERAGATAEAERTLGRLIDTYLEGYSRPNHRPRTRVEVERYLRKLWAPLHDRPLHTITAVDVDEIMEQIGRDHGKGAASKARVYLRAAFAWGMRQPRLRVRLNPIVGTADPAGDPMSGRALKQAELRAVWEACEGRGEFGQIIRLLMLLGARRDEIGALPWAELDLDRGLWRLPAARAKAGRAMARRDQTEHEVPLPRQAVALLASRERTGPYVFGRAGRSPFSGYSRAKASLDRALGEAVKPWRIHDLRRSAVTGMAEIGIAPHITEACINHLSGHKGGVAGIYNFAEYQEPKKQALQAWADWLEALIEGREPAGNVVRLRGSA